MAWLLFTTISLQQYSPVTRSENKKIIADIQRASAAVLINMPIWCGLTFGEICMFSFGKNLAQALMKYSPIDPPAAAPSPTYGHCSTPSPLLSLPSHAIVHCSRVKSGRAVEGRHRGRLPVRCLRLLLISQSSRKPAKTLPRGSEGYVQRTMN